MENLSETFQDLIIGGVSDQLPVEFIEETEEKRCTLSMTRDHAASIDLDRIHLRFSDARHITGGEVNRIDMLPVAGFLVAGKLSVKEKSPFGCKVTGPVRWITEYSSTTL